MSSAELFERDQSEIRRSAEEAKKLVLTKAEVDRYLSPQPNTPYSLEYAFHLLGDANGKKVLDLGCGTGANIIPLAKRGAQVSAIDISPDLIFLAERRVANAKVKAFLKVASAYETGLPDASIDVIFCMALIHHLDIRAVRDEMCRILVRDGMIILSEPIRFSATYDRLRKLLPQSQDVSDHEHPLTRAEVVRFAEPFKMEGVRYFRLPILPLAERSLTFSAGAYHRLWKIDYWMLKNFSPAHRYATNVTMRLRKQK